MKLLKRRDNKIGGGLSAPALNQSKKTGVIILIAIITAVLIAWVISIGKKAEATVSVVMLSTSIHKGETITAEMLQEYDMVQGEFEKYVVKDSDGAVVSRRLILWSEKDSVVNTFAAYPLQQNKNLEVRDIISSRVDNSDTALYSFPGKDLVKLEVGESDLGTFKSYLQPGDKINIEAVYSEKITVEKADAYGGSTTEEVEQFRSATVFSGIRVADLLNQSSDSVLDIYAEYNDLSIWEQASLDESDTFKSSITPSSLLLALTPEEKELYYEYLSKDNVTFKVSLPQRSN